MKVILSFYGIFIGIFILSSHFSDLSMVVNVIIDIIGGFMTIASAVVISNWLRKILKKDPPDNLLK